MCYQGVAKRNMGKIPKGYRIQVPSSNLPQPTAKELKKALEEAGFNLSGLFNQTSAAADPFTWEWSK